MNLQDQIEEKLRLNSSTGRAKFDSKLVKTRYPIQGVKMAFLEAYAKTLASQEVSVYDIPLNTHEEIMLAGFVIAYQDIDELCRLEQFEYILPYIDNWSTCDSIVPRLKKLKNQKDYFVNLLSSQDPFKVRVGIIFLMKFYLKQDLIDTLNYIRSIVSDDYYVKMAIAWMLAEAMVYNFDYTLGFLNGLKDKFVINKSIQKALESFRITEVQKLVLKQFKTSQRIKV